MCVVVYVSMHGLLYVVACGRSLNGRLPPIRALGAAVSKEMSRHTPAYTIRMHIRVFKRKNNRQ